jgi:hypothetical protein
MRATHVARPERSGFTLCGRSVVDVDMIDPDHDCVEDATCKACGRADDARCIKIAREEERAARAKGER